MGGGETTHSYTAAEYRAAYKAAGGDPGPWALEANPDRNFRTSRRKPILGFVMHITAGLTDYVLPDSSAEGTSKYGATTTRDASWHVTTDSDTIIPGIRDSYVAWHAGIGPTDWSHPARPYINDATLGMEQGTSQVDWRRAPADWVERILRNDAVWLAPRVRKYKIPLVVVRDRDVMGDAIMAERPFGFISHAVIAPHNRRDPGMVGNPPTWVDTYPWAQLFAYIREELALLDGIVPEEDDMTMTPQERADFIADIAASVWAFQVPQPARPDGSPVPEPGTWPAKTGLWSANTYAYQAAVKSIDVDALATAIAAKLPSGTDPVTVDELAEAFRKVLGSLDNPTMP